MRQTDASLAAENRRLQTELKRVTEERGILEDGRVVLCKEIRAKYAFMQAHLDQFRVVSMFRVLGAQRSAFYVWQRKPQSKRYREDQRLRALIKQTWLECGTIYGYSKVTDDLRDLGEHCGKHRVARLMMKGGPAGAGRLWPTSTAARWDIGGDAESL